MRNVKIASLLVIVLSLLSFSIAHGQLGEVAGQVHFNVSIGGSQTLNMTVVNSGSSSVGFTASLNSITKIANTTTPKVTVSPASGVLLPHQQENLQITVSMPYNSKDIGKGWEAIISVVEQSNSSSSSGGITVQEGVAKIITISAKQPTFPLLIIIIIVVIVAVVAGAAFYFIKIRGKKPSKKSSAKKQKSMSTKKTTRTKTTKKSTSKTTKKSSKKKTTRKTTSTRSSTTRTRRRRSTTR